MDTSHARTGLSRPPDQVRSKINSLSGQFATSDPAPAPSRIINGKSASATLESDYVELTPNVRIELLTKNHRWQGLGEIEIDGVKVRGSRRPMFVQILTPDGIEFFDFELCDRKATRDGAVLEYSMKARTCGIQEWMLHTIRNLRVTRDWASPEWLPTSVLRLHLRAIESVFEGRAFRGFEYFYEFESPDHPIYRLLDMSSWAIGDSLHGNTFWLRNCFAEPLHTFNGHDDFYSTEWYLGSIANPNIFQFQPFQTNMESFTMMTGEKGQLLTIAPRLFHLRSFFEKPRKADEILHWHEHCSDLTSHFKGAPLQVLFSPEPATEVDLINLNGAVRDSVSDSLHHQAGLRRERITTYGIIEEWGLPNLKDYTERILPQFLKLGIRCIFLPNQFQNNMNVWGVSNMCCTVDYKMPDAETEAQLKAFCQLTHEAGSHVQMWGNTALSSLDFIMRPQDKACQERAKFIPTKDSIFEVIDSVAQPYIRNPSGAIESDHYNPSFLCLNLREPAIRDYWHRCWRKGREQIGIDGIFLDSSFNLSSDKFHYSYMGTASANGATADQSHLLGQRRPDQAKSSAILSMYFAHLQLIAEMQSYGFHYSGEDVGVFGLRRSGPGIETRLNNLFLWSDCYGNFDCGAIKKAGMEPDDVFFRGLAYRLMWGLYWNFGRQSLSFCQTRGTDADNPSPWHLRVLQAFNRVEERMLRRHVLDGERGVHYFSPGGEALWAFSSFEFELKPNHLARNILTSETFAQPSFKTERFGVYEIEVRM